MPPKRKRTEDAAAAEDGAAARTTRRSARNTTAESTAAASSTAAKPAATKKAPAKTSKAKKAADQSDGEEPPPPKKARATKASTTKAAPAKGRKAPTKKAPAPTDSDDENTNAGPSSSKAKAPKAVKHEPYTPARAKALFNAYEDADEKDVIGAEGFMRLCEDAGIEMEGAHPLILAWHLQCKEMAKISREEWMKGLESLQTGTLPQLGIALKDIETLLVHGETSKETPSAGKTPPYNKAVYQSYAADPQKSFRSLYNYCYTLIKPPQSKNIDMETACAMWSVLLAPKYPHMKKIVDFTTERIQTHRAANKDLWQMMLEFCETVSPNLDNYEADGAWPTLLDEFVEHEKGQQGNEQDA
ncbi:Cullin binding-domain-containing protein [Schizophyllum commune]